MNSKTEIERRFEFKKAKNGEAIRTMELRKKAIDLANAIAEACPDSREKSLALTKLEESVMWANKSVFTNEDFQ